MIRRGFGRVGRRRLVGTVARTAVVAGTATAVSGTMIRHQNAKAEEQQDAAAYRAQTSAPPPAPVAAPPQDQVISQLQQLAQLKAQGVLTEAEFEQQKARILGT